MMAMNVLKYALLGAAAVEAYDCPSNLSGDACSCIDATPANIVNWRKTLNYNSCCAGCAITYPAILTCLAADNCTYNDAKRAFEHCGSADWPAQAPAGFDPPHPSDIPITACKDFDASYQGIIDWRGFLATNPLCGLAVVRSAVENTCITTDEGCNYDQARAVFEANGSPSWRFDYAPTGFIPPQSVTACNGYAPTTENIKNWRADASAACQTCVVNNMSAAGAFNPTTTVAAFAGELGCGADFSNVDASALTDDDLASFPQGPCAGYDPGANAANLPDWRDDASETCQQCVAGQLLNSEDDATKTCLYAGLPTDPTSVSCTYTATRAGFAACGSRPLSNWPEQSGDSPFPPAVFATVGPGPKDLYLGKPCLSGFNISEGLDKAIVGWRSDVTDGACLKSVLGLAANLPGPAGCLLEAGGCDYAGAKAVYEKSASPAPWPDEAPSDFIPPQSITACGGFNPGTDAAGYNPGIVTWQQAVGLVDGSAVVPYGDATANAPSGYPINPTYDPAALGGSCLLCAANNLVAGGLNALGQSESTCVPLQGCDGAPDSCTAPDCNYSQAKQAFELCALTGFAGGNTWPSDEPAGFLAP